jgi:chemotaxis protein MotB
VSFQDALLFETGSADINAKSLEMLQKLTVIANSVKNYIRVEGSTDDVPISSSKFPSNWELASQRAINVAKALVNFGVTPSRISATSYGEYRPVIKNNTAENRKLNRRVDVVFVNEENNTNEPGYGQ